MKFVIAAAMAAAALAITAAPAPALAQNGPDSDHHDSDHGDQPGGWDLDHRIDWMQDRIDRGRADGSLGHHEAWRAQDELNDIRHDEERLRYQHHGLYDSDRQQLDGRLDDLSQRIHWLRRRDDIPAPWRDQ